MPIDGGRMDLRGGRARSLLAPCRRQVDECGDDRRACHRCSDDGDLAPRTSPRTLASLRSLQPIYERAVPEADGRAPSTASNARCRARATSGTMRRWRASSPRSRPSARHGKDCRTRDAAKADVFDYIERFYNLRRRHSTLGYLSPVAYEERMRLAPPKLTNSIRREPI